MCLLQLRRKTTHWKTNDLNFQCNVIDSIDGKHHERMVSRGFAELFVCKYNIDFNWRTLFSSPIEYVEQ